MKKISRIAVILCSSLLLSCTRYKIEMVQHKTYTIYTPMYRTGLMWRKGTPLFNQKIAEEIIVDWKESRRLKRLNKLYIKVP